MSLKSLVRYSDGAIDFDQVPEIRRYSDEVCPEILIDMRWSQVGLTLASYQKASERNCLHQTFEKISHGSSSAQQDVEV
jgi:hypothetical protein